jgi:hypothetical protein
MPANSFGELRLYVVIDQVRDKDVVPWLAKAILVYLHSEKASNWEAKAQIVDLEEQVEVGVDV